jgi:hypothetical protein
MNTARALLCLLAISAAGQELHRRYSLSDMRIRAGTARTEIIGVTVRPTEVLVDHRYLPGMLEAVGEDGRNREYWRDIYRVADGRVAFAGSVSGRLLPSGMIEWETKR